jgi:hypothetical protein
VADVLDHQQRISGWFELPLPAGNWQVAVKVGQDNHPAGAFALARDLVIGADATLGMSDIVIGRKDSPEWPATDEVKFPLNVHGAYTEREAAELFYEVRGIARDSSYRTTIDVRPAHAGDPGGIRIANTDRSGGGVLRLRKTLGLERLRPGSYILTVTVTSNGKSVSRSRPLLIADMKGKSP